MKSDIETQSQAYRSSFSDIESQISGFGTKFASASSQIAANLKFDQDLNSKIEASK